MINLKEFYNNFSFIFKNKFDLVIFSEGEHYQVIYAHILEKLNLKKIKILYLTIDKKEKLFLKNVKFIYIGSGLIRQLYLNILTAKIFLTTTPDIGNNEVLLSKKINKYCYIFHSAASTHKLYNKNAFDNFDIIMSNGNYQINELKELEKINNSKKKYYLETGYIYFDYLNSNITKEKSDYILIAPSWNSKSNNFTNDVNEELIDSLLTKNYKVIFRPHPEQIKRNKNKISKIKIKYKANKNFMIDFNASNLKALNKSKLLITDNSAIAIEFLLIIKKPVLYVDYQDKINNFDHKGVNFEKLEDIIKYKFGYTLDYKKNCFDNIANLIKESENKYYKNFSNIDSFLNNNFYNFGNVADKAAEQIISSLDL